MYEMYFKPLLSKGEVMQIQDMIFVGSWSTFIYLDQVNDLYSEATYSFVVYKWI